MLTRGGAYISLSHFWVAGILDVCLARFILSRSITHTRKDFRYRAHLELSWNLGLWKMNCVESIDVTFPLLDWHLWSELYFQKVCFFNSDNQETDRSINYLFIYLSFIDEKRVSVWDCDPFNSNVLMLKLKKYFLTHYYIQYCNMSDIHITDVALKSTVPVLNKSSKDKEIAGIAGGFAKLWTLTGRCGSKIPFCVFILMKLLSCGDTLCRAVLS